MIAYIIYVLLIVIRPIGFIYIIAVGKTVFFFSFLPKCHCDSDIFTTETREHLNVFF